MTNQYFKPYQVIAGNSFGGLTDRDIAWSICNYARMAANTGIYNSVKLDNWAEVNFRDLAYLSDDMTADFIEDISNNFNWEFEDLMPAYCTATWEDNEFTIVPNVEAAIEDMTAEGLCGDEIPDDCRTDYLVVNERGNVTYFQFVDSKWDHEELWNVV